VVLEKLIAYIAERQGTHPASAQAVAIEAQEHAFTLLRRPLALSLLSSSTGCAFEGGPKAILCLKILTAAATPLSPVSTYRDKGKQA
jgi:hypothetical protein